MTRTQTRAIDLRISDTLALHAGAADIVGLSLNAAGEVVVTAWLDSESTRAVTNIYAPTETVDVLR